MYQATLDEAGADELGSVRRSFRHTTQKEFPLIRRRSPATLAAFSGIPPSFRPRRRLMTAPTIEAGCPARFAARDQITSAANHSTTACPQA
ncbi:hypothetical protein [Streptomyces sp. NPDC056921]|uniref:hypothetical protein n=1 Tax=Streptomyces sp. NPDC056921 TaxID=3345966 RepID=UPI003641AC31